jgi:hypothetical protein
MHNLPLHTIARHYTPLLQSCAKKLVIEAKHRGFDVCAVSSGITKSQSLDGMFLCDMADYCNNERFEGIAVLRLSPVDDV